MPLIEEEKQKRTKKKKVKEEEVEIVSAYSQEGKERSFEKREDLKISRGFKVLLFFIYALGLVAALAVIYLIEKYQ